MDTKGAMRRGVGGRGVMNWAIGIDMYSLMCIKLMTKRLVTKKKKIKKRIVKKHLEDRLHAFSYNVTKIHY